VLGLNSRIDNYHPITKHVGRKSMETYNKNRSYNCAIEVVCKFLARLEVNGLLCRVYRRDSKALVPFGVFGEVEQLESGLGILIFKVVESTD